MPGRGRTRRCRSATATKYPQNVAPPSFRSAPSRVRLPSARVPPHTPSIQFSLFSFFSSSPQLPPPAPPPLLPPCRRRSPHLSFLLHRPLPSSPSLPPPSALLPPASHAARPTILPLPSPLPRCGGDIEGNWADVECSLSSLRSRLTSSVRHHCSTLPWSGGERRHFRLRPYVLDHHGGRRPLDPLGSPAGSPWRSGACSRQAVQVHASQYILEASNLFLSCDDHMSFDRGRSRRPGA